MSNHDKVSEVAPEVYNLLQQSTNLYSELWLDAIVFTWRWWLLVGITIVPWIIWFCYRKKESTHRLLLVGFFMMFASMFLDLTGIRLGWWNYHYEVIPFIPSFTPWDLSALPVFTMFFLQIKPNFSPLIKATVYSGIISFGAEPLFKWLDLYEYPNWEYIYSFVIYFVLYLVAHYISTRNDFGSLK